MTTRVDSQLDTDSRHAVRTPSDQYVYYLQGPHRRPPTTCHLFFLSFLLSRLLEEDREEPRDEMQDTTTGAFKAVSIFGYYFAVRAKGADKTATRQADTERTAQTNVPPQPLFFLTVAAFVELRCALSYPNRFGDIFDRSEQSKPRDAHLRDGWT
jgi:hypothetical protein